MNEKALKVIEAAKSQIGNPYVFGMWGRECTPSVRRQYAGYNPSHKSAIYKACPVLSGKQPSCDGCKWQGKLAFDCRGFIYWCIFQGYGFKLKGGGCTSQWGYKINWARQGEIADMPDLVCCVYQYRGGKFQHTGIRPTRRGRTTLSPLACTRRRKSLRLANLTPVSQRRALYLISGAAVRVRM